jgi:AraC-like DNA-binding protein
MIYLQQSPAPPLRPWIQSLWYCRAPKLPHRRERVLPNGSMQIIINLHRNFLTHCVDETGATTRRIPGSIVTGARARFELVDTADMDELAGIILQPGGFPALFRERADLLFEQSAALQDFWACESLADQLREAPSPATKLRTLELLLTRLLPDNARRSPIVDQTLHLFTTENFTVGECAKSLGISERWLSRVFRESVGIAPKAWCRLQRFQSALRTLYRGADVRWADLALDCGYYDQSHFANDFKAFSGVDPTTYSAHRGAWQNHIAIP